MTLAILSAVCLVVVTVAIHTIGLALMIRVLRQMRPLALRGLIVISPMMMLVASGIIILHLVEIGIWASFYLYAGCLSDAESAFYFSGTTYTTIGYGDLVLPKPWRILAPVQALTGILMCGLSASFFFAIVSYINTARLSVASTGPIRIGTHSHA